MFFLRIHIQNIIAIVEMKTSKEKTLIFNGKIHGRGFPYHLDKKVTKQISSLSKWKVEYWDY